MVFLSMLVGCGLDKTNNPLLTENNMLKVDGKATFILGLYENPKDDARLKEAIDAGFNLIMCPADEAALDRVDKAGAKAWISLGNALDLGNNDKEKNRDALLKTVNKFKDHRALLIWEGPDEYLWQQWWEPYSYIRWNEIAKMQVIAQQQPELLPLVNQLIELHGRALWSEFDAGRIEFWKKAGQDMPRPQLRVADISSNAKLAGNRITEGIRIVKETDPKHIVWLNHAPRNSIEDLTLYGQAADMVGCDIYPVTPNAGHSDLSNISLSSVGAYTERMRRLDNSKACAMVLQGFGFWDMPSFRNEEGGRKEADGRRPTFKETRFMAYDAIVHGANAIMYWGTHYVKDKQAEEETMDTQLWLELLETVRQIRAMDQALTAPTVTPRPAVKVANMFSSATEKELPIMLKKTGTDYVLIAVNETPSGLAFTIEKLPAAMEGRTMYRLGSQESFVIKDRKLHDGISFFDVAVYATSRRFEPPAK
jgi:hypothetical protein